MQLQQRSAKPNNNKQYQSQKQNIKKFVKYCGHLAAAKSTQLSPQQQQYSLLKITTTISTTNTVYVTRQRCLKLTKLNSLKRRV